MKVSDLIKQLEETKLNYGDKNIVCETPVYTFGGNARGMAGGMDTGGGWSNQTLYFPLKIQKENDIIIIQFHGR